MSGSRQLFAVPRKLKKRKLRGPRRRIHVSSPPASGNLTKFLVQLNQFTSSVQQAKYIGPSNSVLSYTQAAANIVAEQLQLAWDAGKFTFGTFVLRGDLRLGVTEKMLLHTDQILFQEKLIELIWNQSKTQSWKHKLSEMHLFPMSRADLNKQWQQFDVDSRADFRKRFTTVYLKNCLLEVDAEINCDLFGRIGWFFDRNTGERMFFPITVFDPDISYMHNLQAKLLEIRRLRPSTQVADIHRCSTQLEELKDMLFQEEFHRVLWLTDGKGISLGELKKKISTFTVTPIDLYSRLDRMKRGEFSGFRYDIATERFFIEKARPTFLEQLHANIDHRRNELMRIENMKRYISSADLNRHYKNFFQSNLPSSCENPLSYDETLLTQLFKSWTTHGQPDVASFQEMINLRCETSHSNTRANIADSKAQSLYHVRFPRACKLWRDYIKLHPKDTTLDCQPLLRLADEVGEGGFAMEVLKWRLERGSVPESQSLLAIQTILSTRRAARTFRWITPTAVQRLGNSILAQPYKHISPELAHEVKLLVNRFNKSETLHLDANTPPQLGLTLSALWKACSPEKILPLLRGQEVSKFSEEDCHYLFPTMFQPENGTVEHFATVPVIIESLKLLANCSQLDPHTKLGFLKTMPRLCSEIAQTEKSCRSVELIMKTMEDCNLPISKFLWDAALLNYFRFTSNMSPLTMDEINFWISVCDPSLRLFNRLLQLVLYNTLSNGCDTSILPKSQINATDNTELIQGILNAMDRHRVKPSVSTFNLMLDFYVKTGDKESAFKIVDAMTDDIIPDEKTLLILSELYIDADTVQDYVLSQEESVVRDLKASVQSCQEAFQDGQPRGRLFGNLLDSQREDWICCPSEDQFIFFPRTRDLMSKALSGLEKDLIVLDDEPRHRLQQLKHHYIQSNLPDYKSAFQIQPQVLRNQVMNIIHEAKKEEPNTDRAPSFYVNIYDRIREMVGSHSQEVSMEEIQKLTQIPSYPFVNTLPLTGMGAKSSQLRYAFSTRVEHESPVCPSPTSTVKSLQMHDEIKACYANPSSIKILEEIIVDEDYETAEYQPPLPPQLKALPSMFGQDAFHSAIVLRSSETLVNSHDFFRTILFALPEGREAREQSLGNLLSQALNSFTVLQLCQSFISDISHHLAFDALLKLHNFQKDLSKLSNREHLMSEHTALMKERSEIVAKLFQVSACLHYLDEQYHETLVNFHEVYHSLGLLDPVLWKEHDRIIEENLSEFSTEELLQLVRIRHNYEKDDTDLTHALIQNFLDHQKSDEASKSECQSTLEAIDHLQFPELHSKLQQNMSRIVPERIKMNGKKYKRLNDSEISDLEKHIMEFVSTSDLTAERLDLHTIERLSSKGIGYLLVGLHTHNQTELSIIEHCQEVLCERIINEPTSLDGSEVDALVQCLQHFGVDMGPLVHAQEVFQEKYGDEI